MRKAHTVMREGADAPISFRESDRPACCCAKARRLWEEFQCNPHAQWESEGQAAFRQLSSFVVTAFMGTAGLGFAGADLGSIDRETTPRI